MEFFFSLFNDAGSMPMIGWLRKGKWQGKPGYPTATLHTHVTAGLRTGGLGGPVGRSSVPTQNGDCRNDLSWSEFDSRVARSDVEQLELLGPAPVFSK
jgi:hypothetical protein